MSAPRKIMTVRLPQHIQAKIEWIAERKGVSFNGAVCLGVEVLYDAELVREAREQTDQSRAA